MTLWILCVMWGKILLPHPPYINPGSATVTWYIGVKTVYLQHSYGYSHYVNVVLSGHPFWREIIEWLSFMIFFNTRWIKMKSRLMKIVLTTLDRDAASGKTSKRFHGYCSTTTTACLQYTITIDLIIRRSTNSKIIYCNIEFLFLVAFIWIFWRWNVWNWKVELVIL